MSERGSKVLQKLLNNIDVLTGRVTTVRCGGQQISVKVSRLEVLHAAMRLLEEIEKQTVTALKYCRHAKRKTFLEKRYMDCRHIFAELLKECGECENARAVK